ncbi:Hpt domain-containing response regulator [Thermomonas fusca]|uniref:Response regulator n=1 Tax=Thermomonas fusca TaxID=215690 RepID=A0A5R9PEZ4_9GAMM|nr:response regulator [Thermomonas fusca]TLX22084.1 response regulator [Thermomonas fusca]
MNHSPAPALPRLLLVEDDPVNAAFLAGASAALPAEVVQAGSLVEAEAACRDADFDLFLFDANLPDGRGEDLLRSLRGAGIGTVALAHTADVDDALHTRLLAAGFVAVLRKPLPVATLHAALRRWLPAAETARPCWDDAAALAALGGQAAHVQALRGMFLDELPAQRGRIALAVADGDAATIRAELHKLVASCGFVGAARLGDAVQAMRAAPLDAEALRALDAAVAELLPG